MKQFSFKKLSWHCNDTFYFLSLKEWLLSSKNVRKRSIFSKKKTYLKSFVFLSCLKKNKAHCTIRAELFVETECYLVRDECTDYKTIDYNLYSSFYSA